MYAISSLPMTDAPPEQLAGWLRGHWPESQVMASLRDTAISLLRVAGADNVAAALRHHARDDRSHYY
ncbi:hypothetical protein [Tsukamurella soli]|uniref:Uncharacterized protein n=1 Tax=Tsukamurella soli TaxID=644556 RepID=A0ABP8JY47_9ACTN